MAEVTLDQVRAAKQHAMDVFSRIGRVIGVGITRVDGVYALKVNLSEALAEGVDAPQSIDGIRVRLEVVGAVRPRLVQEPD